MPRYYFDFKSGDYLAKNGVGTALPDLAAATDEAVAAAAEWTKITPPQTALNCT